MSTHSRTLHDIARTGDAEALSAMLIGEVDVNMVDRVSLYRNEWQYIVRFCIADL
jgi:hypothetical protein